MKYKMWVVMFLVMVFLLAGCGEVSFLSQSSGFLLPQIMVETPATAPDGYSWSINNENHLELEKEGESKIFAKGDKIILEKNQWQFVEVEDNMIILKPVIEEPDPMMDLRRQLD